MPIGKLTAAFGYSGFVGAPLAGVHHRDHPNSLQISIYVNCGLMIIRPLRVSGSNSFSQLKAPLSLSLSHKGRGDLVPCPR
jgi:hypothetical protein